VAKVRDAALGLGRLKLQEPAELLWEVGCTALAQAIRRIGEEITRDKGWRRRIDPVSAKL
jgi:hypothetical protein